MDLKKAVAVVPSKRQWQWQQMEYYGFIHFGVNTINDVEWGNGKEDLTHFDPQDLDTDQWVQTLKEAQMAGVILTCKHHDGFCLWTSQTTTFTVAHTPWKNGQGDLVKELATSCHKYGLKFGIYLSPWDQNAQVYGTGPAYDDFYLHQLSELLTNYGDIFCVWLDGANGEGPNGKKQVYDWDRYYTLIRHLQPEAVISVCGPDVRWCGNEAGQTRSEEWSVVPKEMRDLEKIAEKSQKVDDGRFSRKITSSENDLGSRQALRDYPGPLIWYPAEVNTSIRPGWYFHERENDAVRSGQELYDIYLRSVGGNANFLLNIPPDKSGRFHETDKKSLFELGQKIRHLKQKKLLQEAHFSCSSQKAVMAATDFDMIAKRTWSPVETNEKPWIQFSWQQPQKVASLTLQENILDSQRVEAFEVFYYSDHKWQLLKKATIIGYKKIMTFDPIQTTAIKIVFKQFREYPTIAAVTMTD